VARGTLYSNIGSIEGLFDRIIGELSADMSQRVSATFADVDDSAARLATGVRLWVRYAHENPTLGRFAVRFALSQESLRTMLTGPPMQDINAGVAASRYDIGPSSVESVTSLVLGATVSAMWMVIEGHQTWREAGSSTAELLLRALGIDAAEAHEICTTELPRLT
jgi:AcrR family transcriptional regulator